MIGECGHPIDHAGTSRLCLTCLRAKDRRESDVRAGIPDPGGIVVLFADTANVAVFTAHHLTVEGWGALAITDPKILAPVFEHAMSLWPAAVRGRPHFRGGPGKDAIRMIEATAAMRDDGGLPAEASLVFSQLLLNLAGHAGRAKAFEIIGAFLDASDLPVRS